MEKEFKEITLTQTDIKVHSASPYSNSRVYMDEDGRILVLHYLCDGIIKSGKNAGNFCTRQPRDGNGYCNGHANPNNEQRTNNLAYHFDSDSE